MSLHGHFNCADLFQTHSKRYRRAKMQKAVVSNFNAWLLRVSFLSSTPRYISSQCRFFSQASMQAFHMLLKLAWSLWRQSLALPMPADHMHVRRSSLNLLGGPYLTKLRFYSGYVSSDATGTSWANMIMLQNVPAVADRCSVTQGSNEYTLVASFPSGIECTGEGGACLVMCKAPVNRFPHCSDGILPC